jgi:trehalose 6-phosphate phosphatase
MTTAHFDADGIGLFLDLDGTLAEFAPRPIDVIPQQRRTNLLREALARLSGRLAIISGRSLADVDRITEGVVPCVAGSHGLERRNARGELHMPSANPALALAMARARVFIASRPGLAIETKPASFALHFRAVARLEGEAVAFAEQLAREAGLSLLKGAKVVELKTLGPNKGDAVCAFVEEAPFIGTAPIFVGDDVTDEDAFLAVAKKGGLGVLVGAERDTYARARLSDPSAVLSWLERSLAAGAFVIEETR